jgi:sporulation protein YlmC with PRC-barrel domain
MSLQSLRGVGSAEVPKKIDLRSWRVIARDGTPLGTVAEVIVDAEAGTPVYLNVHPHDQPEGATRECWVRVPYRHARVDSSSRRIVLSDIATLGLGTTTTALLDGPLR